MPDDVGAHAAVAGDEPETDLVTGAFGNSGRVIARVLIGQGRGVRTLTSHPERSSNGPPGASGALDSGIDVRRYDFDDRAALREAFEGVTTFYNTFWMRIGDAPRMRIRDASRMRIGDASRMRRGDASWMRLGRASRVRTGEASDSHASAVAHSRALITAAAEAGVPRIVHLSVAHADTASPYPYFRAKAVVEQAVVESGMSYAIARPTLLFGGEAVLLENLAWLLRKVPVFAIGGAGTERVRPVHVEDLAAWCVEAGRRRTDEAVDAVGPERPTFNELIRQIRQAVGSRARVVHVPAALMPLLTGSLGIVLRDTVVTTEELRSTAEGMADSDEPSIGSRSLAEWIAGNADSLGRGYVNERRRR